MKALDCTQGIQSVAVHGAEQRKLGLFKGLKAVLYIKIKSTNNNKSFKKLHYCHFADAFVQSNLVQGLGHFSIKLTFTQRFKTPVCVISLSDCVCFVVWQSQWKQSKCIGVLKATWLPHGCKGLCGSMCCKCTRPHRGVRTCAAQNMWPHGQYMHQLLMCQKSQLGACFVYCTVCICNVCTVFLILCPILVLICFPCASTIDASDVLIFATQH